MRTITWAFLVVILSAVGVAAAQSRYENASRCSSDNPDISIVGCTDLIQSGKETTENLADAFYRRGNAYGVKAQYNRAILDYDQAIHLKPDYASAFNNRGFAYAIHGQYDRAILDYDQAIRLKPDYAIAFYSRGFAYANKGQYDRAILDYDQAIHFKPDFVDALNNRGLAYANQGQYDRAIQNYDQAIHFKPDFADAIYDRGVAYANEGQYDRALEDYSQILRLMPNVAIAFDDHGYANFYLARFAEAITDFQKSLELHPSNANTVLWLHLAKKHLHQDDTDDFVRRSAKVSSGDWPAPILQYFLGKVTAEQLLSVAGSNDANKDKRQRCVANFFLGEDSLLRQDRVTAITRLRAARDICPNYFPQYAGSIAELKRSERSAVPTRPGVTKKIP